MIKRYLPINLLLLSIPFWLLAACNYPGGTSWNTTTDGFSFTANYVSALFQPQALNGMANTARSFAFVAMLLYSTSLSVMFWLISTSYPKSIASKTVQIFGVGAMVYAFIAVTTPMHDLLTIISASFLVIAIVGMLVLLQRSAEYKQVLLGCFNLLLLVMLSVTTKGNVFIEMSPAIEWLLFLSGAVWVAVVYFGASTVKTKILVS